MTYLVRNLQPTSWRGIAFPITGREFGFRQEQATHRYLYRNEQLIESLGKENPTWRYSIPFREDVTVQPWANLFTQVYPEFLNACVDRSTGVLEDPIHGAYDAKCVSLRETLDPNRGDGVDVEAEFVYAPDPATLSQDFGANIATISGAQEDARRLDAELKAVDWKQEEPPPALSDPFTAIGGIADQIQGNFDRVNAKLDDVAWRCDKALNSLDRLKEPKLSPLRARVRKLQDKARRAKVTANLGGKRIAQFTVGGDTNILALAAQLRNSLPEFMYLNGRLVRVVTVRKGMVVRYYKQADPIRTFIFGPVKTAR